MEWNVRYCNKANNVETWRHCGDHVLETRAFLRPSSDLSPFPLDIQSITQPPLYDALLECTNAFLLLDLSGDESMSSDDAHAAF